MLFDPKRKDGRAAWRVVYDLVMTLQPGDLIPHKTLLDELETHDKRAVYAAVQAANKHLWAGCQRSLEAVPGVGYRILRPLEHEHQAVGFQKQSRRKLGKAVAVLQAADLTDMSNAQRNHMLNLSAGMVMLARSHDRVVAQVARHEDLIKDLDERVSKLEK